MLGLLRRVLENQPLGDDAVDVQVGLAVGLPREEDEATSLLLARQDSEVETGRRRRGCRVDGHRHRVGGGRPGLVDRADTKRVDPVRGKRRPLRQHVRHLVVVARAEGNPFVRAPGVARRGLDGTQNADWRPGQAVTRAEALKMFTLWPAIASFQEDALGVIEPGKRADFTVFSKDIMTVPEGDILTAKPVMTVVDGEIIFRAKD